MRPPLQQGRLYFPSRAVEFRPPRHIAFAEARRFLSVVEEVWTPENGKPLRSLLHLLHTGTHHSGVERVFYRTVATVMARPPSHAARTATFSCPLKLFHGSQSAYSSAIRLHRLADPYWSTGAVHGSTW